MSNFVGLQKLTIKDINPNIFNALIVGVIIGKQKPKVFAQSNRDGKGVFSFTIRDCVQDYINVTCWGTAESINLINNVFTVGDIIEVIKPKIDVRRVNDYGEQFRPRVTSPFTLTVNEPNVQLAKHEGESDIYKKLLGFTTKPMASRVTLANILNADASDETVDFLVAVRSIGEVKTINLRNEQLYVREIIVFDNTHPGFQVSIWDSVYIERANSWSERNTVLFMADMKVKYSDFYKSKTATSTTKTIITENPYGIETENLRKYALSAQLEQMKRFNNAMTTTLPTPESVTNVMSIVQIYNKLESKKTSDLKTPDEYQFSCVLYAMISFLDLDNIANCIIERCIHCKGLVKDNRCGKDNCPVTLGKEILRTDQVFDIKVNLSDHTGTLFRCRFNSRLAEHLLGCEAYDFLHMTDLQQNEVKWKVLLERFEFKIAITHIPGRNPSMIIINFSKPGLIEILNKLPHY